MSLKILPSLQRASGDPYGVAKRDLRPTFEVVEGGKVLLVRNLHGRCEQKLVAIWRASIVGTWKTLGSVLIQPKTMRPSVVAKCDSLYTLAVRLPGDASTEPGGLRVYERGDAYAEPGGRAPGFREVARALSTGGSAVGASWRDLWYGQRAPEARAGTRTPFRDAFRDAWRDFKDTVSDELAWRSGGQREAATGFSFGDKKWRYFQVYRLTGTGEPRLIVQRGPVLLTEREVADEMFGWRETEQKRGGILSINRWTYSPESGWRRT
jgi:hypothetical protein